MTSLPRRIAGTILVFIPVVIFYYVVIQMAVNAPFQDDFDGLLEPTVMLRQEGITMAEKWRIIYRQDDERRIIMNRLTAAALDRVFGSLDLRKVVFIGASLLLIFLGIVFAWFRASNVSGVYFLPITWILFNIQYFDAVLWSQIPVQQLGVFVWGFAALWSFSKPNRFGLVSGLFFSVLALYSDVSGAFLIPVILLMLSLQRRRMALLIYSIVIGIIAALYFWNLQMPGYRPSLSDNLHRPLDLVGMLLAFPGLWADPGPSFSFWLRLNVSLVMGLITLGFLVAAFSKFQRKLRSTSQKPVYTEWFLWASLAFLIITFASLAFGRASYGIETVFISRYRAIYVFWLIVSYMMLVAYFPKLFQKRGGGIALALLTLIFFVNSYSEYWNNLDFFRKSLMNDAYEWRENRAIPSSPIYLSMPEAVDKIYEDAYRTGVYQGDNYPFEDLFTSAVKGDAKVQIANERNFIVIIVEDVVRSLGKDDGFYVMLKSGDVRHIFPARNFNKHLHRAILSGSYYYPGAVVNILKAYLNPGKYEVEIGVIKGAERFKLLTGQQVVI